MPLAYIVGVTVFFVGGCIAFFVGINKRRQERQQNIQMPWYKQAYFDMGLSLILLGLFFILIYVPDLVPQVSIGIRVLMYVVAGIVFVGGAVSCLYMIRYFPWTLKEHIENGNGFLLFRGKSIVMKALVYPLTARYFLKVVMH